MNNQIDIQACCHVLAGALLDVFDSMELADLRRIDWLTYETALFSEQHGMVKRQAA